MSCIKCFHRDVCRTCGVRVDGFYTKKCIYFKDKETVLGKPCKIGQKVFIGIYSDYDCGHKILFAVRTEMEALAEVYNRYPENMPESMPEFKDGHAAFDLGYYGAGVDVYEVNVG